MKLLSFLPFFILASLLIYFNLKLFYQVPSIFHIINFLAGLMVIFPLALPRYLEFVKIKNIEANFPNFLRDVSEAVRAGMTLPQAFSHVTKNDYGVLSRLVKKMSAQLTWGIPVEEVLRNFGDESKSKTIRRMIVSILETHRMGGNLSDVFEAIAASVIEAEKIREERKLLVQGQLLTGYLVFFVLLAVLIGLQTFLIPQLAKQQALITQPEAEVKAGKEVEAEYELLFKILVLIQGFFSGLVIGKLAEGALIAGIKHSLILMSLGWILFSVGVHVKLPIPML